jgi:predicted TIM-barrel fold metal-dependent hydrolase
MSRIDADAHVQETEATWEYVDETFKSYKPISLDPGVPWRGDGLPHRIWLIDGQAYHRTYRNDQVTGTTEATRELLDVGARLRHLDELRIDVQILYPTHHIRFGPARPDVEVALAKSYNRWIADRTKESGGRLRWVAILPLSNMDVAIEELRWAKDHGAVGLFKKAIECGDRKASDPYFFPLYEEANRLDVPICVHTGSEGPSGNLTPSALPVISAFDALVSARIPEKFSTLRFGFIEASAAWIPFIIAQMATRLRPSGDGTGRKFELKQDLFRDYRLYVACQTVDDLPDILKYGTEDNILVGTDYTHHDTSHELDALDIIEQKGAAGVIPPETARKILDDNPRRFYGI